MSSSDTIHYFFSLISPYAYLGHDKLLEIARRHNKTIRYRPIMLMKIWESSGAVPLPQRPLSRQKYRLIELQRWREVRAVKLNLQPKYFPTNPTLADRAVISLTQEGHNPHDFMAHVYRAIWAEDQDISNETVLANCLRATDSDDPETILQNAHNDKVIEEHEQNTEAGKELHIIGSPAYVYNGEPFWGQDRLELLDQMLASKREIFHS